VALLLYSLCSSSTARICTFHKLERDFVYRDMSPEERADLERRDVVLQTVKIAEEKLKENPFLQPDDEIAAEED
jgi:hypothetical protein